MIRKRNLGSLLVWSSALLPLLLWLLTEWQNRAAAAFIAMRTSSMQDRSPGWWVWPCCRLPSCSPHERASWRTISAAWIRYRLHHRSERNTRSMEENSGNGARS